MQITLDGSRFSVLGSGLLAALALGALAVTNSWDLPTYALLIGGALLGQAWRIGGRGRALVWALLGAGLRAGAITIGALLLYLPFFQNYVPPAGVRGIGLVRDGSPLGPFLLIYGLYLLILVLWAGGVAMRLLRTRRAPQPARLPAGPGQPTPPASLPEFAEAQELPEDTRGSALGIVARPPGLRPNAPLLIVVPTVLLLLVLLSPGTAGAVWNSPLLLKAGLLALLLAGVPALLARRLPARAWFTLWLAVLAWAVSLGVELIYIRDHLDGGDAYRMNTVFKFGLQAWMLMAVAAAAALPWLGRGLRRSGVYVQVLGWGVIGALVALALVFPLVGTPSRVAYRFPQSPGPTLDGLAFMRQAAFDLQPSDIGQPGGVVTRVTLNDDLEAINWLNQELRGTPIVLQSDLWFYRPYGVRIAANTGLPTIVSPLHASEQHDPEQVAARDRDVQLIYNTPDLNEALRLLAHYHVGYIYIGQIERAAYAPEGIAKFARLDGTLLTLAYQNASVTIYKLNDGVYALTSAAEIPPPPALPQPPIGQPAQPAQPAQPQGGQLGLEQLEQQVAGNPAGAGPVFELAQRYRALGRTEDAIAILNIAAPANPRDVALHQLWGDTLRDAGRSAEAEQAYRTAVAADPTAGNWNKLGLELLKWERLDDALVAFEAAISADANAADPHFHLGEIAEQRGDADSAAEHYRAYLAIAGPEGPFADEAQAGLDRLQR